MVFVFLRRSLRVFGDILLAGVILTLVYSTGNSAIPSEANYFDLLKTKFEASRDIYGRALIPEFNIFRELYPRSLKSDSVEFFLAMLYEQEKMEPNALAAFLKIVYVFPKSPLLPQCRQHLKALGESRKRGITSIFADENLNLIKNHAVKVSDGKMAFAGGVRGYLDFLQLIADAKVKDMAEYTAKECEHYIYHLSYDLSPDRVMVIRGDMFSLLGEWNRAILSYLTAPLLNPYGEAVGDALNKVGNIYLRDLQNYTMARQTYQDVIDKFPAEIYAAWASVFMADIDQAEKNYGKAVIQLEDTAKRFPFPEIRLECYSRISRVYLDNLNNPQKSIAFLERIVSEFPKENRTAEALIRIGEIQEKVLKKYSEAVASYKQLAELFPQNQLTPAYLFQAAELAEKHIKDQSLANSIYKELVQNYPDTEQGQKAAKIIKKK